MLRAALTGGIATGKSFCLRSFAARGVPTIDADQLARDAVEPASPGLAAIVSRFGEGVLRPDGTLDRAALASIVFADAAARAELEAIIHPEVYRRINLWLASQPHGTELAIADIPLLFETGHEHDFDRVIVAACDPDEQLRRVVHRDGLTTEAARARLAAQWPIDEKVRRASYTIRTDGTHADTERQVDEVLRRLRQESRF
jgi:dephospho-CoA kinase